MKVKTIYKIAAVIAFAFLMGNCKNHEAKVIPKKAPKHLVEITSKDKMIYLDREPNDVLLRKDSTSENQNASTKFYCYKVQFIDNSPEVKSAEKKQEVEKYFLYDMSKDWKVIENGDSISPVFYQPLTKRNPNSDEGILVFEISKEVTPDTLFYKDNSGIWGSHIIALGK